MKRLILLVALVMAMAVLAPAAFADESAEAESADVEMEEKDPFEAQLWKAQMIAGAFEMDVDEVISIREGEAWEIGHTIGWGVLYKVMLCGGPEAFNSDDVESGANGWAVGQLCRDYEGDGDQPKNLGQLHKDSKDKPGKSDKEMPSQSNRNKHKG